MATSGDWSSIQELVLLGRPRHTSLTDAERISSFIVQCEILHTLRLEVVGDETATIVEVLSRTKVQSLKILFRSPHLLTEWR